MKLKRAVLMACAGLLFVPTLMLAHHALGVQFDTTQTITLTGAVKNIDWRNPHVRLFLDSQKRGQRRDLGSGHGLAEPGTHERLED